MLDEQTVQEIGVHLGQKFTEGELGALCDLLRNAVEASDYAANDYAERADFERKHNGGEGPYDISEEADYNETAEGFRDTSARLIALKRAIEAGERLGREDHPL